MLRQAQSSKMINHAELTLEARPLGQGGFGVVYKGSYRHSDVAVKQLLMDKISAESAREFEIESQIMAELRSPNIVQFYGFCTNPTYCIVMEYMPNGSLFSILRSDKPLEWPARFSIALDTAKGLAFLHQEGIMHRDIKSLNILLDKHYQAKLTDFGLSKIKAETKSHATATKTNTKDSVGTVQWMAPELFSRKAVFTPKSDIYSLGVTFWELSSREIPFKDAASQELIPGWVKEGEREDIPTACPAPLSTLIQSCWDGAPDKRPTADDLVIALKRAVETTSGASAQPAPQYQGNFASAASPAAASGPVYAGNLGSAEAGPAKPLTFRLPPPPPPLAHSSAASPAAAPSAQLAQLAVARPAIDVNTFLRLVAEGEQNQVEAMLKVNKDLVLSTGDVTDLSNRTFKGITAFQYAVWALDWHMWTMIRKYLPNDAAREQIQSMTTAPWVSQHGQFASWQNLINAIQKQIDLLSSKSKGSEAVTQWQKEVGGAQRLLPVHVINEYCHPSRSFHPCPDFTSPTPLPRTRQTDRDEWFTATYNGGLLGDKFAVARYSLARASGVSWVQCGPLELRAERYAGLKWGDREACLSLYKTRTQQKDQLVAELTQGQRQRLAAK